MCHALDKVLQLAMATFQKSGNINNKLNKLLAQVHQITGVDVGLDKSRSLVRDSNKTLTSHNLDESKPLAPITYIQVSENAVISVGIFIIHEGESIPMHDHPDMHGIIRCLHGNLKISSFTKKDTSSQDLPERFAAEIFRRKIEAGQLFLAETALPVFVDSSSPPCVLYPNMGNIHQIESVNGAAAFLDILSPPYNIDPEPDSQDQEVRDCNYYRMVGDASDSVAGCRWLLRTPSPPNHFVDTEPYQGPKLTRDPIEYMK